MPETKRRKVLVSTEQHTEPTRAAHEVSDRTVAAAAAGRHMAFEVIVREYDERLRAFSYGLLRDRDTMDDVLQEVYLKAYRSLPSFRGESRLSTWLLRITYTTAISHLRSARPEDPIDPDAEDESDVSLEGLIEQVETAQHLRQALTALPAELRACILLVHREGLSYQEVASILGIAPGTVGWRLNAARRRLSQALKEAATDA
jgi:RNA polymerase sigma-70 factor (ECF subfamily)